MYRELGLDNENVFEFVTLKTGWTLKEYSTFNTTKSSDIPIYTATSHPVAYTDKQTQSLIFASPEQPVISFGANGDGSAGTNFVLHESPFYVSNDRTCLRLLDPNLDPHYLIHQLSTMKRAYGFGFDYKAVPQNVKQVLFSVPVTKEGIFDLNKQREIVAKVKRASRLQLSITTELERLKIANLILRLENHKTVEIALGDSRYFSMFIGKRLLKKDVAEQGIPVYSANVEKVFGYVTKSNIKDFTKPALLWGIDWIFNWNYIEPHKEFATTDHCGVIYVESDSLDPKFVYYALKTTQARYGFDRTYRASLGNIKDVVTIQVPVNLDGKFDVVAQKKMVKEHERLENLRGKLIQECEQLLATRIVIDDQTTS